MIAGLEWLYYGVSGMVFVFGFIAPLKSRWDSVEVENRLWFNDPELHESYERRRRNGFEGELISENL